MPNSKKPIGWALVIVYLNYRSLIGESTFTIDAGKDKGYNVHSSKSKEE